MRVVASHLILWIFYVGGFRLKIIGNRADRTEASVLALAPHSSFIDSIAMVYMKGPSIVAKGETSTIPFFGSMFYFFNHFSKMHKLIDWWVMNAIMIRI